MSDVIFLLTGIGKVLLFVICFFGFIFFLCWIDSIRTANWSLRHRREYVEKLQPNNHHMLGKMYAEECKDRDLSKSDARNMVEHYLEWNVKARGEESGFSASPRERSRISQKYRETMAIQVVDLVYELPRTVENTKPHITVGIG